MSILLDSSELREAARLIGVLGRPVAPAAPSPTPQLAPSPPVPPPVPPPVVPLEAPAAAAVEPQPAVTEAPPQALRYRGEQLEHALATMCRRGGLTGAVVADRRGFALAVHNSPVDDDAIAAFTTVLGEALEKAAILLGEHGAENIAMDINDTDKVVLRRFTIDGQSYFIMVLSPQQIDERSAVEISIEQITRILTA